MFCLSVLFTSPDSLTKHIVYQNCEFVKYFTSANLRSSGIRLSLYSYNGKSSAVLFIYETQ